MGAAYLKSPVHHYEHKAGCTGKTGFSSRADAKHTADKRNFKFPPYKCDHCGNWHITRQGPIKITSEGWVKA